eukprot:8874688-Lingulodinium_polyedra.AAC.1
MVLRSSSRATLVAQYYYCIVADSVAVAPRQPDNVIVMPARLGSGRSWAESRASSCALIQCEWAVLGNVGRSIAQL